MRLPTSLYAATLALTANAVLLPPDVSAEPAISIVASKQTIKLDCERCNIAVDNGNWEKGTHGYVGPTGTNKNDLKMGIEMGFSIENKQVALNGVPFYPIKAPGIVPRLSAKQVVSDEINNRVPVYRGELPLSTNIEIQPPTEMRGNNGNLKVHRICLEVIGMADNPVYVPTVQLKVAELPSGELMLLPIETTPYKPNAQADACTTILCRVKAIIAAKLSAFKEVASAKFGAFRSGCMRKFGSSPAASSGRPRLHGGVDKYRGRFHPQAPRQNRFTSIIRRIVHHVLLPILFGVFTGMFVGAMAMLFYTAVRSLVLRARGCTRASYEPVEQEAEEGRASTEGPPKYEDVYVEPEEDVVDEKRQLL